jgi:pyruvate,orthophosphate dikinase
MIQLLGKVALGVADEPSERDMARLKSEAGAQQDVDLSAWQLQALARRFLEVVAEHSGRPFPDDPWQQLEIAIAAVFRSSGGKRAIDDRRQFRITPKLANGTAASICTMVFGNLGNDSATGVGFTRNPATGERVVYGEYLTNAQGEDVVVRIRTPTPIAAMAEKMPGPKAQLMALAAKPESHCREVQDFEFTIGRGKLWALQTRNGKMNTLALVRTSVEMEREGLLERKRGCCGCRRRCWSSCWCRRWTRASRASCPPPGCRPRRARPRG